MFGIRKEPPATSNFLPIHAGLAAALLVLAARPSPATTLIAADFTELVTGAHAIVHGRVVGTHPAWVGDRVRIDTLVTLAVDEYYKGDLGREVVIRVPGGRLGRYRSVLIGAPTFVVGQEVILFLTARASIPYVLGLNQGVFRVRSLSPGRPVVTPVPLVARGLQPEPVIRGDPARRPLTVPEFAALVRSLVVEPARAADVKP